MSKGRKRGEGNWVWVELHMKTPVNTFFSTHRTEKKGSVRIRNMRRLWCNLPPLNFLHYHYHYNTMKLMLSLPHYLLFCPSTSADCWWVERIDFLLLKSYSALNLFFFAILFLFFCFNWSFLHTLANLGLDSMWAVAELYRCWFFSFFFFFFGNVWIDFYCVPIHFFTPFSLPKAITQVSTKKRKA